MKREWMIPVDRVRVLMPQQNAAARTLIGRGISQSFLLEGRDPLWMHNVPSKEKKRKVFSL